jgi:hypothetical protein
MRSFLLFILAVTGVFAQPIHREPSVQIPTDFTFVSMLQPHHLEGHWRLVEEPQPELYTPTFVSFYPKGEYLYHTNKPETVIVGTWVVKDGSQLIITERMQIRTRFGLPDAQPVSVSVSGPQEQPNFLQFTSREGILTYMRVGDITTPRASHPFIKGEETPQP